MNEFQDTTSGAGLLKINYDDESPLSRAMKKRRKSLEDRTITPSKDQIEGVDGPDK